MSAVERAAKDAKRISLSALTFEDDGEPAPQAVQAFIFAMPVSERGEMLNPDGRPTRQAIDRLMAAAFKAACGSDDMVRLYAQATDPDARAVVSALAQAAGARSQPARGWRPGCSPSGGASGHGSGQRRWPWRQAGRLYLQHGPGDDAGSGCGGAVLRRQPPQRPSDWATVCATGRFLRRSRPELRAKTKRKPDFFSINPPSAVSNSSNASDEQTSPPSPNQLRTVAGVSML